MPFGIIRSYHVCRHHRAKLRSRHNNANQITDYSYFKDTTYSTTEEQMEEFKNEDLSSWKLGKHFNGSNYFTVIEFYPEMSPELNPLFRIYPIDDLHFRVDYDPPIMDPEAVHEAYLQNQHLEANTARSLQHLERVIQSNFLKSKRHIQFIGNKTPLTVLKLKDVPRFVKITDKNTEPSAGGLIVKNDKQMIIHKQLEEGSYFVLLWGLLKTKKEKVNSCNMTMSSSSNIKWKINDDFLDKFNV